MPRISDETQAAREFFARLKAGGVSEDLARARTRAAIRASETRAYRRVKARDFFSAAAADTAARLFRDEAI